MTRIVAVINQKGGVGKTTTALNMGSILKRRGNRVLFIDMDPQCNLSYAMNAFLEDKSIYDAMMGNVDIKNIIQRLHDGDMIISNGNVSSYELKFHGESKEYRIKEIIEPIKEYYDYIIIDSPPALSVLTIAILTASDSFIIPANCDSFSAQGVDQINSTFEAVRAYTNSKLVCDGVLLTRFLNEFDQDNSIKVKAVAHKNRIPIFDTVIHESIAIKQANANKKSLYDCAPDSKVLKDYTDFVDEWLRLKRGDNYNG